MAINIIGIKNIEIAVEVGLGRILRNRRNAWISSIKPEGGIPISEVQIAVYSNATWVLYSAVATSAAIVERRFPSAAAVKSPFVVEAAADRLPETVPVMLAGGTHNTIYSVLTYTFSGRNGFLLKTAATIISKRVAGAPLPLPLRLLKLTGDFPATYMCLFGAVDSASDF